VGRVATAAVVVLGLVWIPVMSAVSELGLYHYLQSVQGYLGPPITTVFLLGLFWKRINAAGALWGLGVGFVLGMGKLIIQTTFGVDKMADPAFLAFIGDFNFLYFSSVLFGVSVLVVVGVSLLTAPPPEEKLAGLTYASLTAEDRRQIRESWNAWDIFLTCTVLGLVLAMYIYFSFWLG
jgi:SSS family solute:Na+ symporter